MKDITIKGSTITRELIILGVNLLIAIVMNLYAIVVYNGAWSELFTQMHLVLALTVVLYLIVTLFRLIHVAIKKLFSGLTKSVE
jgi:hypothetical protein